MRHRHSQLVQTAGREAHAIAYAQDCKLVEQWVLAGSAAKQCLPR